MWHKMANFPFGLIALVVISILIYFGVAQRALDRLRLTDRAALAVIAAIIIGSFIDIPVSDRLIINVGGVITVGLAVWLWLGAGTAFEKCARPSLLWSLLWCYSLGLVFWGPSRKTFLLTRSTFIL